MEGRRLYPIGIQTFSKLREGNYVYVDKTELVYRMTHGASGYIFLSRPRRFGKSLLTSTLHSYFEGRKDLFEGLEVSVPEWLSLRMVWCSPIIIVVSMLSGSIAR